MAKILRTSGFTLIELIIVMAILGILITAVTGSFVGKRERARDAKRQEDLKTIQDALEQYYSLCGLAYPTPVPSSPGVVPSTIYCTSPTAAFLKSTPVDPRTGTGYSMTGNGSSYTVTVQYEKITPTAGVANNQQ